MNKKSLKNLKNNNTAVKNLRESKSPTKKESDKDKDKNLIKKPSPYNLFAMHFRKDNPEYLNLSNSHRTIEMAKVWNSFSESEKDFWRKKANDIYNQMLSNPEKKDEIFTQFKSSRLYLNSEENLESDIENKNKKGKSSIMNTECSMGSVNSEKKKQFEILKLKFSLDEVYPTITRIVQIPSDFNFCQLHHCIQDSFNFYDTASHFFLLAKENKIGSNDLKNESMFLIGNYISKEFPTIYYEYKNEDNWKIKIQFISRLLENEKMEIPLMVYGTYANPPENVGGPKGFLKFIKVMSNPKDIEYDSFNGWYMEERLGSDSSKFDFKKFDPKNVKFRKTYIIYDKTSDA